MILFMIIFDYNNQYHINLTLKPSICRCSIDDTQKIDTVTIDSKREYLFWSNKKTRSLYRTNIDGKQRIKIADAYGKLSSIY